MTVTSNFFLLCENFILDTRQRVSIINIYDSVWAQNYPATHSILRYASNVKLKDSGSKSEIEFVLVITDALGKETYAFPPQTAKITPKLREQNVGALFEVQNVTFPKPGRYTAKLSVDGSEVSSAVIELKLTLPPED